MNEIAIQTQPAGLWQAVWKLLRLRWIIFASGFRRASLGRKIGMIVLGLLGLGFLVFVFVLSWLLLRFLRSPGLVEIVGDVSLFMDQMPALIFGGAFLGILLTSFGLLLQALYLSGDMDFLLSKPLSIRAVFISKLLQAILPNFGLVVLFALPVLFGLGAAGGYNFLYYPMVVLMLAALAIAAAGLAALLVMLIVRVFPARRVAEVLGFIGAISSFVCSQSGQLANYSGVSGEQAVQTLRTAYSFNTPWSPLAWAGRGLVGIGEGRWLAGLGFSLLAVSFSAVIFFAALAVSERLYYNGWARIRNSRRKAKTRRAAAGSRNYLWLRNLSDLIPSPVRAVVVKDWLVIRRDLRNMSQLITPLIFGLIYAFMFLMGGGEGLSGAEDVSPVFQELASNFAVYGNVGIALFVGWMLQARLASTGFSQEGKSWWVLKSSPITPRQLLASKFIVAFLPTLVLGGGFLLIISGFQGASLSTVLFTLMVVGLVIAGNTGINLGFGVAGANFSWDDPRKMVSTINSCTSTLVGLSYLPLSLLLFFGPPLGFSLLELPDLLGQLLGLALGGGFSLAAAIVPMWLVRRRISRLGEV